MVAPRMDPVDGKGKSVAHDDAALLERLRAGDGAAFDVIVERCHNRMVRLARLFVSTDASAEEVVQDSWVAVLDRLDSFEGRSSLLTWISRIVVNRAKTRGGREARTTPFSALDAATRDSDDAVDPSRFDPQGEWSAPPARWEAETPEQLLGNRQAMAIVADEISQLPERQRVIVILRDTLGWTAEEVCNVLELHETNQRVLLHRARSRLRGRLEQELKKQS